MEKIKLGAGNKDYSDDIELCEHGHITIIDCKIKVKNIFTKVLSQIKIAVFGDYDIYMIYSQSYSKKTSNYKVETFNRTFCEIVSYEMTQKEYRIIIENENNKVVEQISFQPYYKFSLNNKPSCNQANKIKILGKMEISYILIDTADSEINDEQTAVENKNEESIDSDGLQYKGKGDYLLKEFLDMDLESLKKLGKIHY